MNEVTIKFHSPEAAAHFSSFMCGQGEQDYDTYMDCQDDPANMVNRFNYGKQDASGNIIIDTEI